MDSNGAIPSLTLEFIAKLTAPETVEITYIEPDDTEKTVYAEIGKNMLDVAHDNNIELEGWYA